jgi:hypothetical protein
MAPGIPIYIEVASKRTFAGALEWPGWCRSGRDKDAAIESLLAYARRYRKALGRRATSLRLPKDPSEVTVVERLKGDATTEFGAPSITPAFDRRPFDEHQAKRLATTLNACWSAFDRAAAGGSGVELRTGPRGGGRQPGAMVRHVLEADRAYLSGLGNPIKVPDDGNVEAAMEQIRKAFLDTIAARARGEPPPDDPRRRKEPWTPGYAVRRSAWHALDHTWEIEDRSTT